MLERHIITRDEHVSIAVVIAQSRAKKCGFSDDQIQRIGTAVAELARNICKYCKESGGDMVITDEMDAYTACRLTVVFRDNGPGITNLQAALQDHFSTSGTLGLGLSGVRRLVDNFEIRSAPGKGTVVTISMDKH